MSNGSDIAAEVLAGLIEAGEATGDGKLNCVLKKVGTGDTPWDTDADADQLFDVTGVRTKRTERSGSGDVRRLVQVLLIDATGPRPEKGDLVAINILKANVTDSTRFTRISNVNTVETGNVALLHKADLDD